MDMVYKLLLAFHIAGGFTALLIGIAAYIATKGGKYHKIAGRVYYGGMMVVVFSSILMTIIKPHLFLFCIAVFTLYQVYGGYKSVKNKALKPKAIDFILFFAGVVIAIFMISSGHIVLIAFGILFTLLLFNDFRIFLRLRRKKELQKNQWLTRHIGLMSGSYIATSTAFLVVNIREFNPSWLPWLLPSMIGVPVITYYIRTASKPKNKNIMNKFSTAILLMIIPAFVIGQPYVEGGNTRHRFAQLNLGGSYRFLLNNHTRTYELQNHEFVSKKLDNQNELGLVVGGTHFWGHADFYLILPIATIGKGDFSSGVETGIKIYPFRIENNKIRPFGGISFNTTAFQQGEGPVLARTAYPLHFGFTLNKRKHLWDLSVTYNLKNKHSYYLSKQSTAEITTHAVWFTIAYKLMLETTISAEKGWLDGSTKKTTETLAGKGKLNGFSVSAGPSSAFYTSGSSFNNDEYAFLDNHKISNIFPEFGLGYYWHKSDIHANISYRRIKNELSAYGYLQSSSRRALTVEAYKFLFDFHGFALFAGPGISYEKLNSALTEKGKTISEGNFKGIKPALVFGWDIRPNRLQAIILRTNLRYFPNLDVGMANGKAVSLDNLELNFIQVVIYPNRMF